MTETNKQVSVSVIMAEYNTDLRHLKAAIRSILDQTYRHFEFIIVDDCSKNNVENIVAEFNDKRVKVLRNSDNKGFVCSLNRAIKAASGEYIVRMDTDDISLPERIEKLLNFIKKNPQYDVVGSRAVEFSGSKDAGAIGHPGEKNKKSIMRSDTMVHASTIMKKKALKGVAYYKDYKRAEDFVLWSELLMHGYRLYTIDEVLYRYRVNDGDYSKRKLRNRKDEIRARLIYYPRLNANIKDYLYIAKSVISGSLPPRLVRIYRKRFVLQSPSPESQKNKRINILHVVGSMDMGGTETFLMNALRTIDKDKYQFIFLCFTDDVFDYEKEIQSIGGRIVRIPDVKRVGPLKHIRQIEKVIAEEEIDIVHAHTYYNSLFSLIAARRSNINVRITHSHSMLSEPNPPLLKKVYFRLSALIIKSYSTVLLACGKEAGTRLFGKKRFTIIPNGISVSDFTFSISHRKYLRAELNIPIDATVIGHVGRFEQVKNHDFLIDIFKEFIKLEPNSHLILIGDGSQQGRILKKIRQLDLNKHVSVVNKSYHVNKLYSAMDLFVFPSLYEGMPVALIEAQSNGLTCLVSNAIDKGINLTDNMVFYSLSMTAKQWAEKLVSLSTGRKPVELKNSEYDIHHSINNLESLYASYLNRRVV